MAALAEPFSLRHPDDPFFDEVRVITVPRYKTSYASGGEWRFSYEVQCLRKGVVLKAGSYGSFDNACAAVPNMVMNLGTFELGDAIDAHPELKAMCANPGCAKTATVAYRIKRDYCQTCFQPDKFALDGIIKFCDEHRTRGDCGLQDCDKNYREVSLSGEELPAAPATAAAPAPAATEPQEPCVRPVPEPSLPEPPSEFSDPERSVV